MSLKVLLTACAIFAFSCAGAQTQATYKFNLPEQSLEEALRAIGQQTSTNILFDPTSVLNKTAPALRANLTVTQAIERVLKGTDLTAKQSAADTVLIRPQEAKDALPGPAAGVIPGNEMRLARSDGAGAAEERLPEASSATGDDKGAQEMVVTGTNIRGQKKSASPVMVFDREDIRQTGLATTEQFIQTLPQNFGGGNSGATIGANLAGEGGNQNYAIGTGVNLRGLGNRNTLVLMNGRRLAPAGIGNVVDVSMIPLAAVERVEVLTDGASAIYGSDAVGGVVNFILRDDFQGAETQVRYGHVGSGDQETLQAGQVAGMRWRSGAGILSYEYQDRTALDSADRAFTQTSRDPTDLLPKESHHNALFSLTQDLASRARLVADGIWTQRHTERWTRTSAAAPLLTDARVGQFGLSLGAQVDFANQWQLEGSGSFSRNHTEYEPFRNGVSQSQIDARNDIKAFDVKADGAVFEMAAGAARLAVGGQARQEIFNSDGRNARTPGAQERKVNSLFTELLLPLAQRLELSAAFRYEDYSDFGSTTDPKLGLRWEPRPGVSLRTTYGTSFRAPLLAEMYPLLSIDSFEFDDPASDTGTSIALLIQGNNAQLKPEEAKSWTAGFDLVDVLHAGTTLNLTYFDIDFTGRIATPVPVAATFTVLQNEAIFAPIIDRTPDPAAIDEYFANPNFFNNVEASPEDITVIIDNRLSNIAKRRERGLDVSLSQAFETAAGHFSAGVSGTYLFEIKNKITPAAPAAELLNTVFNPASLKLRANLQWSRGNVSAATFLNHVGGYTDTRPAGGRPVDSWTSVDTTFILNSSANAPAWLENSSLSLSVQNLFDTDPPMVINTGGLNFDPTNASAVGRFFSVQVAKKW